MILVALRWVKCHYSSYFDFDLLLFTQSACVKVIFSCALRCSVKEAAILLLSWSTLYRSFSKYRVSWHSGFYCDLLLLSQSACLKVIYSGSNKCSAKEVVKFLLSWSTLCVAFSKCIVYTDSTLPVLFCHFPPKMLLEKSFLLDVLDVKTSRRNVSSNIAFSVGYPVYKYCKMYSVLILFPKISKVHVVILESINQMTY